MTTFKVVIALTLASIVGLTFAHVTAEQALRFESWASAHGKQYEEKDRDSRLEVFLKNMQMVHEHNMDPTQTYQMELNQFADLTAEEFAAQYLTSINPIEEDEARLTAAFEFNDPITGDFKLSADNYAVDWTKYQSPVKNQRSCGSCWAFAVNGAIEAYYRRASNMTDTPDLSEQELVDCSRSYGNKGCSGGNMVRTLRWVKDNGVHLEADYPYRARDQSCPKFGPNLVQYHISSYGTVARNEDTLASAVRLHGPVIISMDAHRLSMYKSGIFSGCSSNYDRNHGVVIVGYGTSGNTPIWKIRNSWGSNWGENGYFRMVRGKNMCGVQDSASFPVL